MTTSVFCAGVFFLIGLAIMASGWMTYRKSGQAADWIAVPGTILTSEVIQSIGGKLSFSAHIVYEYTAFGMSHTSSHVTIAELMGIFDTGKEEAMARVKKYPAQSAVTVYFDPGDPQRAVLQKNGDASLFYLGGIFMAFAIAIWLLG